MSGHIPPRTLLAGIFWALGAGGCWGLSFIAGLILPGFSSVEISAGRYFAYGLFSIAALLTALKIDRAAGIREPALWLRALVMSLLGNVVYFVAITAGVRYANAPIGSLIIGTLPVVMPLAANLAERTFPWSRLAIPSALMLVGLSLVHVAETKSVGVVPGSASSYWFGIALYLVALFAWTLYGIVNARFLARRRDLDASAWASMQGVALLPVALPVLVFAFANDSAAPARAWHAFVAVSAFLGILGSWFAMLCWTRVTQLLPPSIAGQLLVFETIAGLCYAYAWRGTLPPMMVVAGSAALVAGVTLGVRALARR